MISTESRRSSVYVGDGSTVAFSFPFKIFNSDEVSVVTSDGTLAPNLYSVRLNDTAGGVVTLNSPLATGTKLVIISAIPYTQGLGLTAQGRFNPEDLNKAWDKNCALIQQVKDTADRAITAPDFYEGTSSDFVKDLFAVERKASESAAEASTQAAQAAESAAACEEIKQNIFIYSWDIPHVVDTLEDVEKYPFDGFFAVGGYGDPGHHGQDISNRVVKARGSTELRTLGERFSDVVNVRDFGAKGDGATDDTEAIQKAVNSVTSGRLRFSRGVYLIASPIILKSGVDYDFGFAEIKNISLSVTPYWSIIAEGIDNFSLRNVILNGCLGGILIKDCHKFFVEKMVLSTIDAWNTYLCGVSDFVLRDIRFENRRGQGNEYMHTDGVHIVGPASHGWIENVIGTNGDDMICIQTDKTLDKTAPGYPASAGDVIDITVDGVKTSTYGAPVLGNVADGSTHSLIAFNAKEHRMDRVFINNVSGVYDGSSLVNFSGKYLSTYTSNIGYVKLSNFTVRREVKDKDSSSGGYFPIMVESPVIDTLELENFNLGLEQLPGQAVIRVAPSTNPYTEFDETPITINRLIINNFDFTTNEDRGISHWPSPSFLLLDSNVTLGELSINGLTLRGKELKYGMTVEGAIDTLRAESIHWANDLSSYDGDCTFLNIKGAVNKCLLSINAVPKINDQRSGNIVSVSASVGSLTIAGSFADGGDSARLNGVFVSNSGSIGTLKIVDGNLLNLNFPVNTRGAVTTAIFSNIDISGCKNAIYFGANIDNIFGYGLVWLKDSAPIFVTSSITPKRVNISCTYNGNMPSSPMYGDTFIKSGKQYLCVNGTLYTIQTTLASLEAQTD